MSGAIVHREVIERFLRTFFASITLGFLILWRKSDRATRAFSVGNMNAAVSYAAQLATTDDVYFGVGAQGVVPPRGKRGTIAGVSSLFGLWCDIDLANPLAHAATNLPTTDEDVDWILAAVPWTPSVVVDSGYGRHVYWQFDTPLSIRDEQDRARAKTLSKRFVRHLAARANEKGWIVDPVQDLARVMRVAGTLNHKDRAAAREVRVLAETESRITINAVEAFLEQHGTPESTGPRKRKQGAGATTEKPAASGKDRPPEGGPPACFDDIRAGCGWVHHLVERQSDVTEPQWHGLLSIVARCENADSLIHDVSSGYAGYVPEETALKAARALSGAGPRTCALIRIDLGGEPFCTTCSSWGKVKSPITIGISGAWKKKVAAAIARVRAALAQARASKSIAPALETTVLSDFALVRDHDRLAFIKLRDECKQARVPLKSLDAALDVVAPTNSEQDVSVGDELPDAPSPDLNIPDGFSLDEHGTYEIKYVNGKRTKNRLAGKPMIITGRLVDVATGNEDVEISFRGSQGWRRHISPRDRVLDARRLIDSARVGLPIGSDNASDIAKYLRLFEERNAASIPTVSVSRSLGWIERASGFLLGSEFFPGDGGEPIRISNGSPFSINAPGLVMFHSDDGGDEALQPLQTAGSVDGWLKTIVPLASHPVAKLAIYAGLASILLDIVGCPNFIVEVSGPTSRGKTTFQRIAASAWGDPSDAGSSSMLTSWNSTPNYYERLASIRSFMPLILDDTKAAKTEDVVTHFTYAFTQGRGRGRATKTGGVQAVPTWRGVLISSGERSILSFGHHGGIAGRCVTIFEPPFVTDDRAMVEALTTGLYLHHGHAARAVVRYVIKSKTRWPVWKRYVQLRAATYAKASGSALAGRIARYAATIALTAHVVHRALEDKMPWAVGDPFEGIWANIAGRASGGDVADLAVDFALSWAGANVHSFDGRLPAVSGNSFSQAHREPREYAGRWDRAPTAPLAFFPTVLRRALDQGGFNLDEVHRTWQERGYLDTDAGRRTKSFRVGGETCKLIAFKGSEVARRLASPGAASGTTPPPGPGATTAPQAPSPPAGNATGNAENHPGDDVDLCF